MKGISVWITTVGFLSQYIRAQQLSECPSGRVEVVENSNSFSLTYSGYSGTVTWAFQPPGVNSAVIGTCSSSCQVNPDLPPGAFTLTSQSSSSSRMTSRATTRPTSDGETTYTCGNHTTSSSCSVDIIYPAEVSGCSVKLQENSGTLTVTGSCDVTKVFSSGSNYKCHWFRGDSQSQTESVGETTYSVTSHSDSNYRKGTCSFSSTDLPIGSASYYYRVVVSPGNTQKSVGSISIKRPVTPSITCSPSPYVPENQNVTCTCNTQSVGSPEGRLKWFRGNNLINTGNYGDTTLVMTPQPLTRSDHGNTVFRCDVDWSQAIIRDQYTASVGYIDSPKLTVSPVEVTEKQTVTFTCRADDARPTPYVTLANRDNGTELTNQSSPLSHSVSRARCEDAGVYTCTASNGMGPDMMDDVTLRVKCKPRAVQPEMHPSVNFKEKPASLTFNITANPTPESFNFTFLGPNITTVTASPAGITLNASCQKDAGSLYSVMCTVTVDNVTTAAAGFYRVTLINDQGHGDVFFQVKVNATEKITAAPADEPSTPNIGAIVGGVAGAVLVAAIVAAVVVFVLRKQKDPERRKLDDGKELDSGRLAGQTNAHGHVAEPEEQDAVSTDVYAVVDKSKKSPAETSGAHKKKPVSKSPANDGSGAQPHTSASKPKPMKEKANKGKSGDKERTEHEYGNITLSMAPPGSTAAETGKTAGKKAKTMAGGGAARQPNQDGLLYTTVDFSGQRQQSTKPATPSDQQGVVYSDVLFSQCKTKQ